MSYILCAVQYSRCRKGKEVMQYTVVTPDKRTVRSGLASTHTPLRGNGGTYRFTLTSNVRVYGSVIFTFDMPCPSVADE